VTERSGTRLPLDDAFTSPAAKYRYTRRLFDTIADRYDLITRLLSFGRDQHWKSALIDHTDVTPGMSALDLACGTGDLCFRLRERGAAVAGLDFTRRMIDRAREKPRGGDVVWIVGDMGHLPFAPATFDVVTTGYGLRNVPELPRALAEIVRVLKPGGRVASLDFDRPEAPVVRAIYLTYLTAVGSALGFVLHGDADAYRYIPASIRRYPGSRGVVTLMQAAGLDDVRWIPLLGGLMAIHLARKR
jgi:demethylmenaquinone methyltransferase/2-methoxy-6-polyprenyl-1,4-benzoquinol methylase